VTSISETTEAYLVQSSFAVRLVDDNGVVVANVGNFPEMTFERPAEGQQFETTHVKGIPWRIYTTTVETSGEPRPESGGYNHTHCADHSRY
jgi:hypothetical protein